MLVKKLAPFVFLPIFIIMKKTNKSKYSLLFNNGDKYGKYTIIDNNIIIENEAKILCKCDCGKSKLVSCYTLFKRTATQCSECGNSMKKDKNPSWKGYGNISGRIISKLRRDANKRSIIFDVSIEQLDSLYIKQKAICALSGQQLSMSHTNLTASLDRIDSKIGYIMSNIQWVHKDINMMKKHYNEKYFIEMCRLVTITTQNN